MKFKNPFNREKTKSILPTLETITVKQMQDIWPLIKNNDFDVYDLVSILSKCDYAEAMDLADSRIKSADLMFISAIDKIFSNPVPDKLEVFGRIIDVPKSTMSDLTIGQKTMVNMYAIRKPSKALEIVLKKKEVDRTAEETFEIELWNNENIDHIVSVVGQIAAVVLQSAITGQPFSSKKHDEVIQVVNELPAIKIYPIAFFLLTNLKN